MKGLKRGEYDLVNISLIGHDPITGKSFEECRDEWRRDLDELETRLSRLRWWNIIGHIKARLDAHKLAVRQGLV